MPQRRTLVLYGLVLAVSGSLALAIGIRGAAPDRVDGAAIAAATGRTPVMITNTKQGHSVISARRLVPGKSLRRKVRIRNIGSEAARMGLDVRIERGRPGPNGGDLEDALFVHITERPLKRDPGAGGARVVYDGRLADLRTIGLGKWGPREGRRFRFRVRMPDGGLPGHPTDGDNRYQGSRVSTRFVWQATAT